MSWTLQSINLSHSVHKLTLSLNYRVAAETLNMGSALMHVLSDSLRSLTTLVEAILIYVYPGKYFAS